MMEKEPVLSFEEVGLDPDAEREDGLEGVSFAARPGECVLILLEPLSHRGLFGDLAQGLVAPGRGRVCFEGRDWQEQPPREAAEARSRIGRVYERPLWVSNLDVDENITLVHRHFTARPEAEIDAEAAALAQAFGLRDVPRMRPARVTPRDLRVADWIRALTGARRLLVLERPLREAPPEKAAAFVQAVRAAADRGSAVIWLQDAEDRNIVKGLKPARVCRMAGPRLEPAPGA